MLENECESNQTHIPNAYWKYVFPYLSFSETAVLLFAIRQILGWADARENDNRWQISQSAFLSGGRNKKNEAGINISRNTLKKALDTLSEFRILIPIGEPDENGQMYNLTNDTRVWDIVGLRTLRPDMSNFDTATGGGVKISPPPGSESDPLEGQNLTLIKERKESESLPPKTGGESDLADELSDKFTAQISTYIDPLGLGREPVPGRESAAHALTESYHNKDKPDVSYFPPDMQQKCEWFCRWTGLMPPPKKNSSYKYWIRAFREWRDFGLQPRHIEQAIQKMHRDKLTISSPNSVVNIAHDIMARERVEPESKDFIPMLATLDDGKQYLLHPDTLEILGVAQ